MRFVHAAIAVLLACTPADGLAAEFYAKSNVSRAELDAKSDDASWSNAANWDGNVPRSAQDVGIIGDGHAMTTGGKLGNGNDRPIIQVNPGGTLWIAHDTEQPLRLNGGSLREIGRQKDACDSRIELTADSVIGSRSDESESGRIRIGGEVSNSKPATLSLRGDTQWLSDCGTSLSATISVQRGTLYLLDVQDTSKIGTGEIQLYPATRLYVRASKGVKACRLLNNISGVGTLRAGDHPESATLIASGITLHPGLAKDAGTLAVMGNFGFFAANSHLNKLVIEVHGDGRLPNADYSQFVIRGRVTDSFDMVDLQVDLDPALSADVVKNLSLNIVSVLESDITKFKPFHSVTVRQGSNTLNAKLNFQQDQELPLSSIVLANIRGGE